MVTIKKYQIFWSPQAYNDLQNIHFYLKSYLKESNIADSITKKLLNSISTLNYFPEKYIKIRYSRDKTRNIRRMLVNNYVVIYEINKKLGQISILHIFHNRQNYFKKL